MNKVDKQYTDILRDILEHGSRKQTRAGEVLSVFDRTMRFDLKEGLPLLTTKKMFTKGCIIELLWFLSGDTNIKFLVDNNVNIWTDDAYRYYTELVEKHNKCAAEVTEQGWFDQQPIQACNKDEFIARVKKGEKHNLIIDEANYLMSYQPNAWNWEYQYGDLGDVYGKQWRSFGLSGFDQIQNLIETLKKNPDDRRMLCLAYNPDAIYQERGRGVALPPCHVMFQMYSRELPVSERIKWHNDNNKEMLPESASEEWLDTLKVPRRELSCMFFCRSQDFPLGTPFNIASYSFLTYMMCELTGMVPGELIYHGGDCHIYTNQIEGVREQLERKGSDRLPKLRFTPGKVFDKIEDFKYEDFIIEGYEPDPVIKFPLSVG